VLRHPQSRTKTEILGASHYTPSRRVIPDGETRSRDRAHGGMAAHVLHEGARVAHRGALPRGGPHASTFSQRKALSDGDLSRGRLRRRSRRVRRNPGRCRRRHEVRDRTVVLDSHAVERVDAGERRVAATATDTRGVGSRRSRGPRRWTFRVDGSSIRTARSSASPFGLEHLALRAATVALDCSATGYLARRCQSSSALEGSKRCELPLGPGSLASVARRRCPTELESSRTRGYAAVRLGDP
jgi:hypothetical protein